MLFVDEDEDELEEDEEEADDEDDEEPILLEQAIFAEFELLPAFELSMVIVGGGEDSKCWC